MIDYSPRHTQAAGNRGISLVIVLGSLVFLSALVVAFLVQMGTELKSSKLYAEGSSARILGQSATNIVMAEIKDATKGVDPSQPSGNDLLTWASQPGLIRTFNQSGNPTGYFRLYSWDQMNGTGPYDPTTAANVVPMSGANVWSNQKAIYTNINEPVVVGGKAYFPIVDGNGVKALTKTPSGTNTPSYYSYDVMGGALPEQDGGRPDTLPDVDGFKVDPNAVQNFNPGEEVTSTNNAVPMPVKWLYVLADGTIVAPTGGGGMLASFSGSDAPTVANPIIGRIAFWTDDESCKVNINVASEGVYTDMPRVNASADRTLASRQPVNAEYQRYPGHPAMTSLSTILKKPDPLISDADWAKQIYNLVPRVANGGSEAGTVVTAQKTLATLPSISVDPDRLYASVDELLFKPATIKQGAITKRAMNDQDPDKSEPAPGLTLNQDTVERAKFFLTTNSRSPDLNLFNRPRVGIWPLHILDDTLHRTAFDRLIAFCSTLRNDLPAGSRYRFYFQREKSDDPYNDLPPPNESSVTGLGRNRMLLNYLEWLTDQPIPGFGGSFAAKYSTQDTGPNTQGATDRDQILTQIFDYIRSTNLRDSQLSSEDNCFTVDKDASVKAKAGVGQVVPIEDVANGTRGFGRFPSIQGGTLLFINNIDGLEDPQMKSNGTVVPAVERLAADRVQIQAIFFPQFFNPALGSVWYYPDFDWKVEGLSGFSVNGQSMNFSSNASNKRKMRFGEDATNGKDNAAYGDQMGIRQVQSEDFVSAPVIVPASGTDVAASRGTFSFTGGDVKITLYAPGTTDVIQEVVFKFEDGTFRIPNAANPGKITGLGDSGSPLPTSNGANGTYNYRFFKASGSGVKGGRLDAPGDYNSGCWFMPQDVARSVGATPGDMRLIAARKYTPLPGTPTYPFGRVNSGAWSSTSTNDMVRGMHTFTTGNTEAYYGSRPGRLVANAAYTGFTATGYTGNAYNGTGVFEVAYYPASIPINGAAVGRTGSVASTDVLGDWDNAPLTNRDGPFINKPDEGDLDNGSGPYTWRGRDGIKSVTETMFSPNRMIPSPVTFGSLPTGVFSNKPWQTLLFHPYPAKTSSPAVPAHPGSKGVRWNGTNIMTDATMPADHLLLDLFHMPVVEPYAISEPLSTAGRINMNYQMIPFTYMTRDTGIRALLKSEKVISIADSQAGAYKVHWDASQANIRFNVNVEETLKGFEERFNQNKIFISPSEVCELYMVPSDGSVTYNTMYTYWNSTHRLTGDNSRERIYGTLYPRLTTKSNTFTVHVRAQSLKKVRGATADAAIWREGIDQVTGEYRGSQTIELFVDPNNPEMKDYADPAENTPISDFYQFRVINTKQFAP